MSFELNFKIDSATYEFKSKQVNEYVLGRTYVVISDV